MATHKLTHPDSNHEINVEAAQVAIYESQGWQKKAPAKAAPKGDE